ncbi:MAG: ribosome assembly RNA-binding protein YhbY [Nitrosomonas sp.]|nr:ribosome assembly RNA-binding protein YhbY [Nitrosomonas sp.]
MLTLTSKHRRELKALAHNINPVVIIGKIGLSASIMNELERGLSSHELIKIKTQIDDRETRKELFEKICQQLNAAPVQQIGKILVIYRPNSESDSTDIPLNAPTPNKKKNEPRRTKRSFQS